MPALKPTDYQAEVVWLGRVETDDRTALMASSVDHLELTFAGLANSVHGGATRPSCSRVTAQYPKGTEIRNTRQLSIISSEELADIAAKIGVEALDPARLGATIVLRGIPDFTFVPPSSRLQNAAGVTLTVDMENRPCHLPARSLETVHPGQGKGFKTAAVHRRGVTAWVEREGTVSVGDILRLHVPDQRAWAPDA